MAGDQLAQLLGVGAAAFLGVEDALVTSLAQRLDVGQDGSGATVDDHDPVERFAREAVRLLGDAAVLGRAEAVEPLTQGRDLVAGGEAVEPLAQRGDLVAPGRASTRSRRARRRRDRRSAQLVAAGETVERARAGRRPRRPASRELVATGEAVEALVQGGDVVVAGEAGELVAAGEAVEALVQRGDCRAAIELVRRRGRRALAQRGELVAAREPSMRACGDVVAAGETVEPLVQRRRARRRREDVDRRALRGR